MKTDELIVELASRAEPVRPLAAPAARFLTWFAIAAVCGLIAVSLFGVRPNLGKAILQPSFVAVALLALGTTILGAAASIVLAIPGAERSAWLRGGATIAVVAWGVLAIASVVLAGHGFAGAADWPICFLRAVVVAALPSFLMWRMIRAGYPLKLRWSRALGTTAALAVGAIVVHFACPIDNPAHALLGHYGPVLALTVLSVWVGPDLSRAGSRTRRIRSINQL
jgi:hypothetical protein